MKIFKNKTTVSLYRITNKINGKKYIGITTKSVEERWKRHCQPSRLKYAAHALQRAINKYGKDNFILEHICEIFNACDAGIIERHFISDENTMSPYGYNNTSGGELQIGVIISEETRNKISQSSKGRPSPMKGRIHSEYTKKLMSEVAKSRKYKMTDEQKLNVSKRFKGIKKAYKPISEEERQRRIGKKRTQETKDRISKSNKGRIISEECRKKISESLKGRTLPQETKTKISIASKGKTLTEQARMKISISRMGMKFTEDHKRNISLAKRKSNAYS